MNQKRKRYDSEDSKRRLILAGINIFSKEGYDAATTKRIAEVARVNEALIHRYFKNKLGLFFAILREFHERLSVHLSYPEGKTLEEEIANLFEYRMVFYKENKKFLRIGIIQSILNPKVRNELQDLIRTVPALKNRLEKLRREGKIRQDINLEHLSILLGGITFSMGMFTNIVFNLEEDFVKDVLHLGIKVLSMGLTPKK